MSTPKKYFGTDGIRGKANQFPMTGDVAMKVGRALVYTLLHDSKLWGDRYGSAVRYKPDGIHKIRIVIGKDTRRSGYMIENAFASGVCSMGGEAILLGPLPTPGVAFVTQSMRADAGVMISASHNPFFDNGIKIFGADGFKAPDEIEAAIEHLIDHPEIMDSHYPEGMEIGRAQRIDEVHGRYVVFLKSLFPNSEDLSGMKIALDCAHGAAYKSAPLVFSELGAEVAALGIHPNGSNINDGFGALYPERISSFVKEQGADLGIALDGDADRVILTDENGKILDGDVVMGLCAIELKRQGRLKGDAIVTTPMSNIGLERTLKKHGIAMYRAQVGDRFVVQMMKEKGLSFGGEQSGHLIFLESSTTGDGTLAALRVIELMKSTGKKLSKLSKGIEILPQTLLNVKVAERKPLENLEGYQKALKECETKLSGNGRIFVRYSGTEPKLRILVESPSEGLNQEISSHIKDVLVQDLGASL